MGVCEAGRRIGANQESIRNWIRLYHSEGEDGLGAVKGKGGYPKELKEAAVKDYLSGKESMDEICKRYKIRSYHFIQNWIEEYSDHEELKTLPGGSRMTKGRDTTQAERIAVAKMCLANGKNYGEAAIGYHVSYQQARSWTLKYIEGGEGALEDRRGQRKKDRQPRTEVEQAQIEMEQRKHKLRLLEMENHLLIKLEEIERRRD
jgi:transposase-like protein